MSDELFPLSDVQMDSPRLAWMKTHGVIVHRHQWIGSDFEGSDEPQFHAFTNDGTHDDRHLWALIGDGWGNDYDEALCDWAQKKGVKLWNEECP